MNRVKELTERTNTVVVNLAIAYLFDKGLTMTASITDKQIESIPGNQMMTEEFIHDFVRLARDIAKCDLWNDIMPFIKHDLQFYEEDEFEDEDDFEE